MAIDYMRICMLFSSGSFIATMEQRFLQAVGRTDLSMVSLMCGALTNIILDPVFIFVLDLGVTGAAMATVIGQWVNMVLAILLNRKYNPDVRPHFRGVHVDTSIISEIFRVGLPTIVMQACGAVMVSAVNALLFTVSPTAVAFFGIYYKLQSFMFMPTSGLGQAAIPIAGYSYGAGKYKRVAEMMKVMYPIAIAIALIGSVLFIFFPSELMSLFAASPELCEIGIRALRIIGPTLIAASVTIISGYTASGLGIGFINMAGTLLRQIIILIPCMMVLSVLSGPEAIWYAFWPAELTGAIYSAAALRKLLIKKDILNNGGKH